MWFLAGAAQLRRLGGGGGGGASRGGDGSGPGGCYGEKIIKRLILNFQPCVLDGDT